LTSRDKSFNPALKDRSAKQYPTLALEAFYTDVSSHPDHLPLITATGVLLLEADHVTQPYLHNHACYLRELR
jgi:hypothetical protein